MYTCCNYSTKTSHGLPVIYTKSIQEESGSHAEFKHKQTQCMGIPTVTKWAGGRWRYSNHW